MVQPDAGRAEAVSGVGDRPQAQQLLAEREAAAAVELLGIVPDARLVDAVAEVEGEVGS